MIVLDRIRLDPLTILARGGMGQVYRVGNPIPELPGKLVFKELLPSVPADSRAKILDAMRQVIGMRDAMTPIEQNELDSVTVWPLGMVRDRGEDVGFVMRSIPDDFLIGTATGSRVFEFQLLSAGYHQARANGFDKTRAPADNPLVRLALMARLARAVAIIHRPRGSRRLVFGDISLRNAAVATSPPRILLMDCDGVADQDDPSRLQPNTPFFAPPEITRKQQTLQDQVTDVYKLALCVIRGLAVGRGATQVLDPASPLIDKKLLDQTGIVLLRRAIGDDRGQRPTAEDIMVYLDERVRALGHPPRLLSAALDRTMNVRGADTFVRWTHRHGQKIRISGAAGFEVDDLDADEYPNGYAIRPPTAGPIFVEVTNKHGSHELMAGYLDFFEPPEVEFDKQLLGRFPSMAVPDQRQSDVADALADLPPYPAPEPEREPVFTGWVRDYGDVPDYAPQSEIEGSFVD
jgi:hypothetical protein